MIAIKYSPSKCRDIAAIIAEEIKDGRLVVIPTDTCYGLAAYALNSKAVERVFQVKRRPFDRVISVFVGSKRDIYRLCLVNELAEEYIKLLPARLTLILRAKNPEQFPRGVVTPEGNIGIRLSPHPLPTTIAEILKAPITATSANISGEEPIYDSKLIPVSLPDVDILVDAGKLPEIPPSTVVDLTGEKPVVLRKGSYTLPF